MPFHRDLQMQSYKVVTWVGFDVFSGRKQAKSENVNYIVTINKEGSLLDHQKELSPEMVCELIKNEDVEDSCFLRAISSHHALYKKSYLCEQERANRI